jgi:site-specific recombinase XerD
MARNGSRTGIRGEILTAAEVRQLLRACNRGATGCRNRALLALLWRAGLRCGEALGIGVADLDADRGLVRVRRGKGGRERWVGLDPEAFTLLGVWLERRRSLGLGGKRRLFTTLRGEPLSDRYCRAMVKRVALRAGIRRRVHLHALRHAHAVELVREGTPLPEVQAQLGHANLATTSVYLDHVTPEDLADRARRRPSWADESER